MDRAEPDSNLLPDEAYLYFPHKQEQKTPDGIRRIFEASTEYDAHENKMIEGFKRHCDNNKHALKPIWSDSRLLRFLQANHWKFDKALASVKEHDTWREGKIPPNKTPFVESFLNDGIMYVHGRDHLYRPIIIFNAYKLDPKKVELDKIIEALTYFFEFVIANLLLPGQVENWIFILDLNKTGIMSLPKMMLKKVVGYLQNNYRGHLWTMNIINSPNSIFIPWSIIKGLLDDVTVKKIQFFKTSIPSTLFALANKEQVEQKFGGTAQNITQFWPPSFPSSQYLLTSDSKDTMLITRREYVKRHRAGVLSKHVVSRKIIDAEAETVINSPIKHQKEQTQPIQDFSMQLANGSDGSGFVLESNERPEIHSAATSKHQAKTEHDNKRSKDDQDISDWDFRFVDLDEGNTKINHSTLNLPSSRGKYFQNKGNIFE